MEWHNHALGELAKAKNDFYEKEVKRKNRMEKLRLDLAKANNDESFTNKTLNNLKELQAKIHPEPQLSDFYKLSQEMV